MRRAVTFLQKVFFSGSRILFSKFTQMASQEYPDPVKDFKGFQASLFKALVAATAAANSIPVEEVGFYRSLDRDFAKDLDHAGSSSLAIGNALLQQCATDSGLEVKDFEDIDDVVQRYGIATDVCDGLLEKAVSIRFKGFIHSYLTLL